MSAYLTIIVMALIQGVTEFLPVSSSGHLALISNLTDMPEECAVALSIVLHAGSLAAITVFYFKTLIGFFKKDQLRLLLMLIIGSIPSGIIGIWCSRSGFIDEFFGDMISVGMCFLVTGAVLRLTGKEKLRASGDTDLKDISLKQSLAIGIAQAAAILPGISRSGSTIAAGILSGVRFEAAATFSFLLAMPAIFGASLLEFIKFHQRDFQLGDFTVPQLVSAFILSAVVSFAALSLLISIIRKQKLHNFSWYLFFLGAAVIIWQLISLSTTR